MPRVGVRGEYALDGDCDDTGDDGGAGGDKGAGEAAGVGVVADGADFKALRLLVSIRRVSPSREGPGAG